MNNNLLVKLATKSFTQKIPAVCARQKNNPSTASGPPSFASKVKCFPNGIAPT